MAEKYGRPLVSDERPISTYPAGTLGANLLTLRCRFVHPPSSQKQHSSNGAADVKTDQFELEVPRSFDVYTVLGMLGKRLGIFALHLHLVWETGEWDFAGPGIRPIQEAGIKATRQDRDGSGSDKVADNKTHYDTDNDEDEGWWDSEEEEVECRGGERAKKVPRETVIVHGRRAIGNWVDGDAADLRVEYRPR